MHELLLRQLAADFCVTEAEVLDSNHHFTVFQPRKDRRRFLEIQPCILKIAVVQGKLLFTGQPDVMERCQALYATADAPWFMEAPQLAALNRELQASGAEIRYRQPFYLAEEACPIPPSDLTFRLYTTAEIEAFRGDTRFSDAFGFSPEAPDMLGIAALQEGKILGMAGASADSPYLWQIGVNVLPEARGQGIASMLVSRLRNEVLARGKLPFYGTSISHLESQRVALRCGFLPAWFELVAAPIGP